MARISSASASARARARHRALPYHCISQSFDLPTATTSQSVVALALELAIELALDIEHYRITASVNHLTCPLPPHQSVI